MKIETKVTIDGVVVEKVKVLGGIEVYRRENEEDDEAELWFVNSQNQTVMFRQHITADYGQCTGYISDISFYGV